MTLLRQADPERFLCCLYMPDTMREDVAALWAFDAEIAKIPFLVSEPLPGEIRMQWWRDLIRSQDVPDGAPLAAALMTTIKKHDLPRENFHTCLEARTFDLYQDAMPDMNTLEGYLGETRSMMFQLAAQCSGAEANSTLADASGHAGVAFGLARLLAETARYRHRQQMYVPLTIAAEHRLFRNNWLFDVPGSNHVSAIRDLTNRCREHLEKAGIAISTLPKNQQSVFRNLSVVTPLLRKIDQAGTDLFEKPVSLSPITRFWAMFRGKF